MKKLTFLLALLFLGAFTSMAQDPDLIYEDNWDTTESETGILSTWFGGIDPGLVIVVDNFVVPEGESWNITEFRHRGYLFSVDDVEVEAPEGFMLRIYEDDNGQPGELLHEETFMDIDHEGEYIALELSEQLQLNSGTYWVGFAGYYEEATGLDEGGWVVITWRAADDPLNESVPYISDEGDLLELGVTDWQPVTEMGFAVGALDFAIVGTVGDEEETFTVTFVVEDEDGEEVEDAVVVLGPFTNEAGDYVFEDVPAGTHQYTVTAEGYQTATGEVTVEDDTTVEVTLVEGEDDGFEVTFIVDMTGATVEIEDGEDIVFDPEEHRVFIAGNFPQGEWDQPGTNEDLEMQPVGNGGEKLQTVIYSQDFEGDFPPENWIKLNPDQGSGWDVITAGTTPIPGWEGGTATASPAGGQQMVYATYTTGGDPENDQWLVSPQLTMVEGGQISYYLRYANSDWADTVDVRISTTVNDDPDAFDIIVVVHEFPRGSSTEWEQFTHDLSEHLEVGQEFYVAFREHVVDNFAEGSIIMLDMFEYSADENGNGDRLLYSITLTLPEGDYMYKYFLVDDEPTWDLGEWTGDPNREISVMADMTVEDVWGDQAVSVDDVVAEKGILIYPNPASANINVASANLIHEIRIFDLAGRMVYSNNVQDFRTVINVSTFNRGMYFMQIFGENGVETQKIQVMK